MEKTLFILSSNAGSTEFKFNKDDIYKVYKKRGLEKSIEIIETKYKYHSTDITKDFIEREKGDKSIIVCGGDGSLNEVANVLYPSDTALGLIPMGTANDFSKNFSYKNFSLEKTLNRKIKPIDLIEVNGKICVNVTSIGFDTKILANAYRFLDKNPSLGKKAYIKSVIYSLKNIEYESLEIEINSYDGKTIKMSGDYLLLAICNGGFYGSGFNPSTDAVIDDGILNTVFVNKIPFLKLIPLIIKYKAGKHENSKYFESYKVKSCTIKSNKNFIGNIDGEIFETNQIDFKVLEKAINWIYFE
ncbi:MAG: diacylglycerol/lipid kinase family protein [Anaerococcus sp.]